MCNEALNTFFAGGTMIALVCTLIYVAIYANSTKDMARATESAAKANDSMAAVQREEIDLRKRPVVAIGCQDEIGVGFWIEVTNLSNIHAKARLKVTVRLGSKVLAMKPGDPYAGESIWNLQAGLAFRGLCNISELLKYNSILAPNWSEADLQIRIESWVINYSEPESLLQETRYKNPVVRWYWKIPKQEWIPDIAPCSKPG